MEPPERALSWPGCVNVRDLGGLATRDGGRTRHGALVRADAVDRLTDAGWVALHDHGVRTVIDLRNPDQRGEDVSARPRDVATVNLPLEDEPDDAFWRQWADTGLFATPLYFLPYIERFPYKIAALVHTVADAVPGGVAIHCRIGRDRTGLAALVLLLAAGVEKDDVVADYLLSDRMLAASDHECRDVGEKVEQLLAAHGASSVAAMERAYDAVSSMEELRSAVPEQDLVKVRHRLAVLP